MMLAFQIIGMVVVTAVALMILALIIALIIDFFAYQRGARNTREYGYSGEDRSKWYWTKYGIKTWLLSFRRGGGWFFTVGDPEDDNYDLHIYEDGKIIRERNSYSA